MNAVSIPGSEEFEVLSPSCIEIVQRSLSGARPLAIGCDNPGVPLARSTLLFKDFGIAACTAKNMYAVGGERGGTGLLLLSMYSWVADVRDMYGRRCLD
ncbi:hypothetical protein AVEN_15431-1 [Araneus ventricosus]|uniref:Uncharacterized protein n=1 Tax=Araneus ventricosus TaxID=182803 RepID=A0A4Y2CU26_ARAVE|nr:hypothetical protein AVEN_15431-1 [Araneus ventricosus]